MSHAGAPPGRTLAIARCLCACRRRRHDISSKPSQDLPSWLLRTALFLDASALIQFADIPTAQTLTFPSLGLGPTPDATWDASAAIAKEWLDLARVGRLGDLWPRVVRTATVHHIRAFLARISYTGLSVVSYTILLTGIQNALANGAGPLVIITYACALFGAELTRVMCSSAYGRSSRRAAQTMQHAIQAALLLKCSELGPHQADPEGVVALLASDTASLFYAGATFNLIYAVPVEAMGLCVALVYFIGIPAAPAIVVIILLCTFLVWMSFLNERLAEELRQAQNRLLRITDNVLHGLRAIKMMAWEAPMLAHLRTARARHIQGLWRLGWLASSQSIFTQFLLPLSTITAVSVSYSLDITLQPSFIAYIQLFGTLQDTFWWMISALRTRSVGLVATRKIQDFLVLPTPQRDAKEAVVSISETQAPPPDAAPVSSDSVLPTHLGKAKSHLALRVFIPDIRVPTDAVAHYSRGTGTHTSSPSHNAPHVVSGGGSAYALTEISSTDGGTASPEHADDGTALVVVRRVTATWEARMGAKAPEAAAAAGGVPAFALRDLSFQVRKGEVLGIGGAAGAGKSAVMSLLLGDLARRTEGDMHIRGSVAIVSQSVWLEAGSVQQNILFGRPLREQWYATTIRVCGLERDIAGFALGDQTPVGEHGGKLSGGQQARVALARAVYADADIYLLDDPLAALDNAVAARLWKGLVRGTLAARGKAVVFSCARAAFLEKCDDVLFLVAGETAYHGPPAELPLEFMAHNEAEQRESTLVELPDDVASPDGSPLSPGGSPMSPGSSPLSPGSSPLSPGGSPNGSPLSPMDPARRRRRSSIARRGSVTRQWWTRAPGAYKGDRLMALVQAAKAKLAHKDDPAGHHQAGISLHSVAAKMQPRRSISKEEAETNDAMPKHIGLLEAALRYIREDTGNIMVVLVILAQLGVGSNMIYKCEERAGGGRGGRSA